MKSITLIRLACLSAVIFLSISGTARGSGYAILEQSGKGLGEAYSGGTTDTEDPSSIFYNPSAMAFMEKNGVAAAVNTIDITAKFRDDGSTTAAGTPLTGGDGGDGGTTGLVPNLYWVQGVGGELKVGLGINSPFGLATEYDDNWKGRYHAVKSELLTVEISPAVALQLTDFLSAGATLNLQYADAELTNAIDFGSIFGAPQAMDGSIRMTGDDWGVGYSLGLLCYLTPITRLGANYRSKIDHTLSGKVEFSEAPPPLTAQGLFVDTGGRVRVTTPESVSLGLAQEVGESIVLLADVTWTRWSRFEELRAELDRAVLLDPMTGLPTDESVTVENWKDTLRYSIGINFSPDESWTLRAGTCYDESPVETEYRTPRLPDNNRVWLALGATYRFTDDIRVDIGYAHIFIRTPEIDLQVKPTDSHLIGKYDTSVNIYSLQLTMDY